MGEWKTKMESCVRSLLASEETAGSQKLPSEADKSGSKCFSLLYSTRQM